MGQESDAGTGPGKELVPAAEMVDRIKAAVDARTDEGFVIMARTDALAGEGLAAAIERARAYVEAERGHDFCGGGDGSWGSIAGRFARLWVCRVLARYYWSLGRRRCGRARS